MKRIKIILILALVLIGLVILKYKKHENADFSGNNLSNLSNEALQNIASVYANTNSEAVFNKIKVTNQISGNLVGDVSGNVSGNVLGNVFGNVIGNLEGNVTGNLSGNVINDLSGNKGTNVLSDNVVCNKLCIGNTCIEQKELLQMLSNRRCAGFAVDGEGTTMPLYDGSYRLTLNGHFNAWTQDRFDIIYCYRGWQITMYDSDSFTGISLVISNKKDDVPHRVDLDGTGRFGRNKVSSYKAEWIGMDNVTESLPKNGTVTDIDFNFATSNLTKN